MAAPDNTLPKEKQSQQPAQSPKEKLVGVEAVLKDEEAYLSELTYNCPDENAKPEKPNSEPAARTFGMAISGGGIRSATFGLGVLQGMARAKLLQRMKYISTVSGGGYIGGWLISWIHRTKEGVRGVEKQLGDYEHHRDTPRSAEPKQVNFLRDYSNYMTPRIGIFGADTWAAIASYLRNVVLNQVILVAFVGAILMCPWFFGASMIRLGDDIVGWSCQVAGAKWAAGLALATLCWAIFWSSREGARCSIPMAAGQNRTADQKWAILMVAVPLFVSASLALVTLWLYDDAKVQPLHYWVGAGAIAYGIAHLFGLLARVTSLASASSAIHKASKEAPDAVVPPGIKMTASQIVGIPISAAVAGAVGGLLLWLCNQLIQCWKFWADDYGGSWHAVGGGPPILVLAFLLVGGLHIGLLKLMITPEEQEWWGRLGGVLLLGIIFWAAIFGLAIFAPWAVQNLSGNIWVRAKIGLLAGWIGSTILGLISGRSEKTSGKCDSDSSSTMEAAALVAPYVFVLGLLIVLSLGTHSLAVWDSGDTKSGYWEDVARVRVSASFWQMVALAALAFGLAYRVDINIFSMNLLYRNRLVRCYLGASRTDGLRQPNHFTGFDPADDLFLTDFDNEVVKRLKREHEKWWAGEPPYYDGPYPIVCSALNVTHGERLAWQERKAESFVFTPKYCGFEFPEMQFERVQQPTKEGGNDNRPAEVSETPDRPKRLESYRDTENYAYPQSDSTALHAERGGLHLGTAISISGAAASPNMGFHTSPPLAFLMTVFDVRMGWWLPNSRFWNAELRWLGSLFKPSGAPPNSLTYILRELAASTTDQSKFVYVSDGGHFENLAIYELVRRRCKYIIACDGDADEHMTFGDLGNCIRKCRSDFGVEITLKDVGDIKLDPSTGVAKVHAVLGEICYPPLNSPSKQNPTGNRVRKPCDKDEGFEKGTILYIKPTVTKDVPRDVLAYRADHKEFPDQTTADQWFDESQFESYRRLGQYSFESTYALTQDDEPPVALKRFFDEISGTASGDPAAPWTPCA